MNKNYDLFSSRSVYEIIAAAVTSSWIALSVLIFWINKHNPQDRCINYTLVCHKFYHTMQVLWLVPIIYTYYVLVRAQSHVSTMFTARGG